MIFTLTLLASSPPIHPYLVTPKVDIQSFTSHSSFLSLATTRAMALTKSPMLIPKSQTSLASPSSTSTAPITTSPTAITPNSSTTSSLDSTAQSTLSTKQILHSHSNTKSSSVVLSNPSSASTTTPSGPNDPGILSLSEWRELISVVHRKDHAHAQTVAKKINLMGLYHPELVKLAKEIIANCDTCLVYNPLKRKWHSSQTVSAIRPWCHVQIDLIGPLPVFAASPTNALSD